MASGTSPDADLGMLRTALSHGWPDGHPGGWEGGPRMAFTADAADARAWAAWIRLALTQMGVASSAGRVSSALREPHAVAAVRHQLIAEIARGPRTGTVALRTAESPEFVMFAHYQRGASVWLAELASRGVIAAVAEPGARRFEAAMLGHVGLSVGSRGQRTIDLSETSAPTAHAEHG